MVYLCILHIILCCLILFQYIKLMTDELTFCTNVDHYSGKSSSMKQGAKYKAFGRRRLHLLYNIYSRSTNNSAFCIPVCTK